MKKLLVTLAAAAALLATSCNLNVDQVYLGGQRLITYMTGGEYVTTVYSSGPWTATVAVPDGMNITIDPISGGTNAAMTITVAPYTGDMDCLEGYVVLNCGKAKTSFPVYQMTEEYFKALQEQGSLN